MVSNDAPIIMAKACELFVIDLAFRSEFFCKNNKRKILSVTLKARWHQLNNFKHGTVRLSDRQRSQERAHEAVHQSGKLIRTTHRWITIFKRAMNNDCLLCLMARHYLFDTGVACCPPLSRQRTADKADIAITPALKTIISNRNCALFVSCLLIAAR